MFSYSAKKKDSKTCPNCQGSGILHKQIDGENIEYPCTTCNGKGEI